ncbi:hypothetical protein GGI11_008611, partial [Coemansia sp. RSA 2049]
APLLPTAALDTALPALLRLLPPPLQHRRTATARVMTSTLLPRPSPSTVLLAPSPSATTTRNAPRGQHLHQHPLPLPHLPMARAITNTRRKLLANTPPQTLDMAVLLTTRLLIMLRHQPTRRAVPTMAQREPDMAPVDTPAPPPARSSQLCRTQPTPLSLSTPSTPPCR